MADAVTRDFGYVWYGEGTVPNAISNIAFEGATSIDDIDGIAFYGSSALGGVESQKYISWTNKVTYDATTGLFKCECPFVDGVSGSDWYLYLWKRNTNVSAEDIAWKSGETIPVATIVADINALRKRVSDMTSDLGRSIKLPERGSQELIFPAPAQRAGMVMGFDEDGHVAVGDQVGQLHDIFQAEKTATTKAATATKKANEATSSAAAAKVSETNAETSASTASTKAGAAASSASAAARSAATAKTNADRAEAAKEGLEEAELNASNSATSASNSATNAASSASAAASSATSAANSASSAATYAATASTKASSAATSATSAASSEANAKTSETNASTSEKNAATSATTAGNAANRAISEAQLALGFATDARGYAESINLDAGIEVLPLGTTTALGKEAFGLLISPTEGVQLWGTHFLVGSVWDDTALKMVTNNISLNSLDESFLSFDYSNKVTMRTMPNDGNEATYAFEAWEWTDSSHSVKAPTAGVKLLKPTQATALENASVLNMEESDARYGRLDVVNTWKEINKFERIIEVPTLISTDSSLYAANTRFVHSVVDNTISQVKTNTSNIATNTENIATNTASISRAELIERYRTATFFEAIVSPRGNISPARGWRIKATGIWYLDLGDGSGVKTMIDDDYQVVFDWSNGDAERVFRVYGQIVAITRDVNDWEQHYTGDITLVTSILTDWKLMLAVSIPKENEIFLWARSDVTGDEAYNKHTAKITRRLTVDVANARKYQMADLVANTGIIVCATNSAFVLSTSNTWQPAAIYYSESTSSPGWNLANNYSQTVYYANPVMTSTTGTLRPNFQTTSSIKNISAAIPKISDAPNLFTGMRLTVESIVGVLNKLPTYTDGGTHRIGFTTTAENTGIAHTDTTETFTVTDDDGTEYSVENCPLFTNDDADSTLRKAYVLAIAKKGWEVLI